VVGEETITDVIIVVEAQGVGVLHGQGGPATLQTCKKSHVYRGGVKLSRKKGAFFNFPITSMGS